MKKVIDKIMADTWIGTLPAKRDDSAFWFSSEVKDWYSNPTLRRNRKRKNKQGRIKKEKTWEETHR